MNNVTIKVHKDYNTESIAEEITHQLNEEGYDMDQIEVLTEHAQIHIESPLFETDENLLDLIIHTTDGYRESLSTN